MPGPERRHRKSLSPRVQQQGVVSARLHLSSLGVKRFSQSSFEKGGGIGCIYLYACIIYTPQQHLSATYLGCAVFQ